MNLCKFLVLGLLTSFQASTKGLRCYVCDNCVQELGGLLIDCSEVYAVPSKGDLARGSAKVVCKKGGKTKSCILVDDSVQMGCVYNYDNNAWLQNTSDRIADGWPLTQLDNVNCYCDQDSCNAGSIRLSSSIFVYLIIMILCSRFY